MHSKHKIWTNSITLLYFQRYDHFDYNSCSLHKCISRVKYSRALELIISAKPGKDIPVACLIGKRSPGPGNNIQIQEKACNCTLKLFACKSSK